MKEIQNTIKEIISNLHEATRKKIFGDEKAYL